MYEQWQIYSSNGRSFYPAFYTVRIGKGGVAQLSKGDNQASTMCKFDSLMTN